MTVPDAAGIEAALAAGLAAHRLNYGTQLVTEERLWYAYCSCPGEWTFTGPSVDLAAAHDAHVAAALLPVVTRAQTEAQAAALYSARDALYRGEGPDAYADSDVLYGEWLGGRADRLGLR